MVQPAWFLAVFNITDEITKFPTTLEDIPVGEYALRVSLGGYKTELLSVAVEKGKTTNVHVILRRESGPPVKPEQLREMVPPRSCPKSTISDSIGKPNGTP